MSVRRGKLFQDSTSSVATQAWLQLCLQFLHSRLLYPRMAMVYQTHKSGTIRRTNFRFLQTGQSRKSSRFVLTEPCIGSRRGLVWSYSAPRKSSHVTLMEQDSFTISNESDPCHKFAVESHSPELCNFLIEAGADKDARTFK